MTKSFCRTRLGKSRASFEFFGKKTALPVAIFFLMVLMGVGCREADQVAVGPAAKKVAGPGPSLVAPSSVSAHSAGSSSLEPISDGPLSEGPSSEEPDSEGSSFTGDQQVSEVVSGTVAIPTAASSPVSSVPPSLSLPSLGSPVDAAVAEEASSALESARAESGRGDGAKKNALVEPARDGGAPITVATEAERNQKIASDWPKPWVTLFLTGQQKGYIEPCGCTGLENQKGGLNRRDTLLKMVKDRGWDVVPLDAGNQVRRKGRQAEMIFRFSADAMANMGYRAIALGEQDLRLSSTELLQITASEGNQRTPFTSCNVSIVDPSLMNQWQVLEVNQRKIGVTAVLGTSKQNDISSGELVIEDPVSSLQKAMAALKDQNCHYYVLLAHANLAESAELARLVPGFDLVVTAGGEGEPTYLPEPVEGTKSLMVQVGVKGMYVGLVGLFDDANNPVRYQRIALSSQFEDSPRMLEAFRGYQEQLQRQGFEKLEVVPVSHPTGRTFVGTQSCSECHTSAFEVWKDSAHAHATQSLIHPGERSDIPRHFDPECLSCHVTGWNPQKFYPYSSGYLSVDETPLMMENGCENCHGPGSQHVAAENGDIEADETLLTKLREEMRLPLAQAQEKCLECHDIDNSPNFHKDGAFEEFWEQVKHYGKD